MAKPSPSTTPQGIDLKLSWLSLGLLILALFTFFNGFLNSNNLEYGSRYVFECTYLGDPTDRHADLIKTALSLRTESIPGIGNWSPHYQEFFLHNAYGTLKDVPKGQITVYGLMPLVLLIENGVLGGIKLTDPEFVVCLFYFTAWMWLGILCWQLVSNKKEWFLAFLVLALSYPFMFALTRGNIGALIVGAGLIPYIYLCCVRRHLVLAALCLALACNVRPNVVLMAPLLLSFGLRKATLGWSIFFFSAAVVGGLAYITNTILLPGYSYHVFLQALDTYYRLYVIGPGGDSNNASAYGALKLIYQIMFIDISPEVLARMNGSLTGLVLLAIGWTSFQFWRGRLAVFHFAFVLTALYALGTSVFSPYHLVVFFVFILATGALTTGKEAYPAALLFISVALLVPKSYFFFAPNISCEGLVNPLILMVSVVWILLFKNQQVIEIKSDAR